MSKNILRDKEIPKVSLIVPVYNVEDYVDECIVSMVAQTFADIEILLINDGSTDSSGEICEKWSQLDSRIRYYSKKNEGLGPTRNFGMQRATGKYISFIDSDDWIDKRYIEKLYKALKSNDADLVKCDYVKTYSYTDELSYFQVTGSMGREYDREELILYGNVIVWGMLSKASIWTDYNIQVPNMPAEDLAIHLYVLSKCTKIAVVQEGLYFYRKDRSGNITSNGTNYFATKKAFEYLIKCFIADQSFDIYNNILYMHCLRMVSRKLSPCINLLEKEQYFQLVKEYKGFLNQYFTNWNQATAVAIGSYSLTKMMIHLPLLENPYNRYSFSSIIAIMLSSKVNLNVEHNNPYRNFMIQRELNNEFLECITGTQPKYLFLDFMEERFDMIHYQGQYITYSNAFSQLGIENNEFDYIERSSEKCNILWKNACNKLLELCEEYLPNTTIVMVENYLSTKYYENEQYYNYENKKSIIAINNLLKDYYGYFAKMCKNCVVVHQLPELNYVTDAQFEYGCYPYHYHERLYGDMARYVGKIMGFYGKEI